MSKRTHSQSEQLVVCGGAADDVEITEIEEEEEADDQRKGTSTAVAVMSRPAHDKRLCVFHNQVTAGGSGRNKEASSLWIDEFMYNLKHGNFSVAVCDSPTRDLYNLLLKIKNKLHLDMYMAQLYPTLSKEMETKLVVKKPKPPCLAYEVGVHVRGGKMPFYFIDNVIVRRCMSEFGEFLTARWSNMNVHNTIFSKIVLKYNGWENDMITMRDDVLIKVPQDNNKSNFVKMFFDIKRQTNADVYERGIAGSEKQLVCEAFDVQRFDQVFPFNMNGNDCKPSEEVHMTMLAIIEGFRQGKDDIELETINNRKIKERWFGMAIQPVVFFNIEQ
uniref:DNA binding protein-1 n=1 Tax=Lymantria dispar multicapsid nuclear polyhedrosis virus TaxID=10449 RepID=A0A1B1MQY3_NPVLD|nr:DNA binding protein-1 [Lymantria dispar multiple nucleopolyhedrovirus]